MGVEPIPSVYETDDLATCPICVNFHLVLFEAGFEPTMLSPPTSRQDLLIQVQQVFNPQGIPFPHSSLIPVSKYRTGCNLVAAERFELTLSRS